MMMIETVAADVRRTPPTEMLARRHREPVEVRNAGFPTGKTRRPESRRYGGEVHGGGTFLGADVFVRKFFS